MVGFPLLLIPLAIYNIIVFLMPGVSLRRSALKLTLMSGAEWPVTLSDILMALGILLLLFEVIKGARPGAKYLTDHLLSLIVFGAAAAEFVLWSKFGTSTYFLLVLLALVDFLSGIALRARRSALVASPAPVSRKSARKADPPVHRTSISSRSGTCAIGAARGLGRRIRAARSPANSTLPQPAVQVLAGTAAGRSSVAGHAAALIQMLCLVRKPHPRARVRAVGDLRVGRRAPAQASGLRHLLGGRDQLGDKAGIGPVERADSAANAPTRSAGQDRPGVVAPSSRPRRPKPALIDHYPASQTVTG